MTPAEIAVLKNRIETQKRLGHAFPYVGTFAEALALLTLAEQGLRLREAARVVVEAFTDPDPTIGEIAEIEALRAALAQAQGGGE